MSDKRFLEISATATVADFTSSNYVPMDGGEGAAVATRLKPSVSGGTELESGKI